MRLNCCSTIFLTIVSIALVQLPSALTAHAQTVDLENYLPNSTQTWFMSLQSNFVTPVTRYSTDIGRFGGQLWWRWQFSPAKNEFYDLMYWDSLGAASHLHYQGTYQNCDAHGDNCEKSVVYPDTIVFAPRLVSGAASGSGSTPALLYRLNSIVCSGTTDYVWQVLPMQNELTYLPRIVQAAPMVHIRTTQHYYASTGACANLAWVEDLFFGTVTIDGANTLVFSRGGPGQYADDSAHWDLLVRTVNPVGALPTAVNNDPAAVLTNPRLTGPPFYPLPGPTGRNAAAGTQP